MKKISQRTACAVIVFFLLLILNIPFSRPSVPKAKAATFSMQTGYYVGDGNSGHTITGLGFTPNLVLIKSDAANSASNGAIWSSSAMPAGETAFTAGAFADVTGGSLISSLDSGGFTVGNGAGTNQAGLRYTYIAFGGSDCTSAGTFCAGSYTGNGTAGAAVSTGFQPDLVWVKNSQASYTSAWTSSVMPTNVTQFFSAITQVTTNADFQSLTSTGFTLGTSANVNTNGTKYWFVAFKKVTGAMNVGSYTGTGSATSTTGMGFAPNFVFLKNANAGTAVPAGYNITQSNGDYSSKFTAPANITGNITSLNSDGFSVGASSYANGSGNTIYWAGFGGAASAVGSGTFTMANGLYTGTGASSSITGLGFSPSLVIIGGASQYKVFRTALMKGNITEYLDNAASNFASGISSLDTDGFSIGTSTVTNTSGTIYYWTAFGNAWNPETKVGASDFVIGAYSANGIASTSILDVPFQPDLVTIKENGAAGGTWRSSAESGTTSSFFDNTADASNNITALNTNGFQIGTASNVNTLGSIYYWFGFKGGTNFKVGTYTGTGSTQSIAGLGFQPDFMWAKDSVAVIGAANMSSIPAGTSLRFTNTTNVTNDITNLTSDGFTLGTGAEVNTNADTYWYAAWQGKNYVDSAYRLFANLNSTNVGSPLAAQNATSVLSVTGAQFRLRMLVRVTNGSLYTSGQNFKLQFTSSTACGSAVSYIDVTTSSEIAYYNNSSAVDGSALTANANDPVYGTDVIDNQTYEESKPFTNSQSAVGNGEDGKWDFSLFDNGAPSSTAYCFRATESNGTVFSAYTVYPGIVTAAAAGSLTVSNAVLNGGSAITLIPNATTTISITASTTAGSYAISYATGTIYRTSLGGACTPDNRNCYQISSSSCAFSGSTTTVTCTVGIWYFADSTGNASSSYPSDSWTGAVTVTDAGSNTVSATSSNVNVGVLKAINVTTSTINYGTIIPSSTTGSTNQAVTIQNAGNSSTTLQVLGTALLNGGNTIATSSQHYATSSFTFGGAEQLLSDTASTISGFLLGVPSSTSPVQSNLYWGLGVPSGVPTGTYIGGVTFLAS